ncbi:response regulator transcription factor [Dyadobacter sandarakinus]|uniref:Response regulator transcription factor n=1 Tax=Dyadobacter sandarakinus TaxID=2747268 RepID=A0ABX7I3F0_9BACT|nr:response regulator transcription factor [Dyadobacter sandarakinus]QRR00589.1 response regulator transcription factor [Dyadobacter sandarakinus]
MHVLLVEDDPKLAGLIQKTFFNEQIYLEIAYDDLIGKRILEQRNFDSVILDISLPGNGFDLCAYIKTHWAQTPVLVLTALGTLQDKIAGFHAGADDYLTKPFDFQELILRIKALTRRNMPVNSPRYMQLHDLTIDMDAQVVRRAGQLIELSKREYDLLEYLMINKGRIVGRSDIFENVWDLRLETNTNLIDVYINYLRRKVDRDFDQKLIHTVIGRGYTLRES